MQNSGQNINRHLLLYDGTCGLCHHSVTFTVKKDSNARFCFAPLQGQTAEKAFSESERNGFPDSIVVQTTDKRTFVKSSAVVFILSELGGFWKFLSALLWIIPKPIRDFGYDIIASVRHRFFPKQVDWCPIVPEHQRQRFLP